MARITSRTETAYATGTSYTVTLGEHVTGDLLMVCLSNDNGGTTITGNAAAVTAGWTLVGNQAASQGCRQVWFWVIATSGAMANPTFNVATNGTTGTCLVIKEAHGTPIGGNMRSDWGNSTNINSAASNTVAYSSAGGTTVITPAADSLLLYSWCCDGAGIYMRTKLSDLICDSKRAYTSATADTVSHIIGHVQLGSAACPNVTMYAESATEGGNGWVIEIKNVANGTLQKQVRADITETGSAANWYGNMGAQHAPVTWNKMSTFLAAAGGVQTITVNGAAITLSDTALASVTATGNLADSLWGSASSISNSDNANVLAGGWHTISSTNLDGKIFGVLWSQGTASTSGRINTEGILLGFASSDGNYAFYQVCTKAIGWFAGAFKAAIIDLNNATLIASGGTIDWTAINRVAYGWHRASGSATADTLYIKLATVLNSAAITGGSATDPANFQVAPADLGSWGHKMLCDQQASAQIVARMPLHIGDGGGHETYFDSSASSVEFERGFSVTQKHWNVNASRVGITIKAGADDTIIMAAGVAASETAQLLAIHADSSLSATYSFIGESIVGLTPTDNAGLSWTSATFKSGGTVTLANGADLTTCSISRTTSTNAALAVTANGSVLTSTTIDGTGAAYAFELASGVKEITIASSTITAGSTNKGHVLKTAATVTAGAFVTGDHYEIKTVGTTDFTLIGASANTIGVRFTATGAGSGTGDAYAAVKITTSGTTSLSEGEVTSAGAVVWVAAPQPTLSATVLASSRVVLYNNTTAAELDNTAPAGTSWSKVITSGASANDSLTLHVFKEGYQEFSTTFLYTGDDATILVTQETDPNLTSLRTELSITDYTTITEFALDTTGSVEIDADDADGNSQKARVAIWYNGVLTTENGARYLRGAISILSTAAFRINVDVLDLLFENISATKGLNFTDTDRRLYRSDGTPIWVAASAPGSIQNDYSGVPDTVTTSDQSLNLATAEQALDNKLNSIAAAMWAYVITGSTTAVQMMRGFAAVLLGKVSGAGTGTETFRDIADTTDVVVATVDSDGNRTAITRTLT